MDKIEPIGVRQADLIPSQWGNYFTDMHLCQVCKAWKKHKVFLKKFGTIFKEDRKICMSCNKHFSMKSGFAYVLIK